MKELQILSFTVYYFIATLKAQCVGKSHAIMYYFTAFEIIIICSFTKVHGI